MQKDDAVVLPTMTMTTTSCDGSTKGDGLIIRKGGIMVEDPLYLTTDGPL